MPPTNSLAESLASLPAPDREALLAETPDEVKAYLAHDWGFWARPSQLSPAGKWRIWLLMGGRGSGKTRTGAEWVRMKKETCGRIALAAPTAADARDVIVEGESGILACSPPWDRPAYIPSNRRLLWKNGAMATIYSAEEAERFRGPQHDAAWADELRSWRGLENRPEDNPWDMLLLTLRLADDPQVVVTTTPRPVPKIKALLTDPTCVVTRMTTWENARNLAGPFMAEIVSRYQGTRLGRQELDAQMIEDMAGALWSRQGLDDNRKTEAEVPQLSRLVVAVDPAVSHGEGASETGIVVAGKDGKGRGWVLADLSVNATPDGWARRAVAAYRDFKCDRIVAEKNNGGEMVELTLKTIDRNVPVTLVHASRGKRTRAEPVAALYEQGRVHHVGTFTGLEDQLCSWTPEDPDSPDRLDALVWALTEVLVTAPPTSGFVAGVGAGASYWRSY